MTASVTKVESFEIIWQKICKIWCIFGNSAGHSKGLNEKTEIQNRRGGRGLMIMILGFRKARGGG